VHQLDALDDPRLLRRPGRVRHAVVGRLWPSATPRLAPQRRLLLGVPRLLKVTIISSACAARNTCALGVTSRQQRILAGPGAARALALATRPHPLRGLVQVLPRGAGACLVVALLLL
jgi:hypothetical protein